MVDPRYFAPADLGAAYMRGVQMREHREDRQNKKRLGELIPQAMGRGGMGEEGALGKDAALDEIYRIDPNIGMKLDDHQRKIAQDVVGDLGNAVRWADTPEKWSEVQAFYATRGIDLSKYSYDQRERGLMALGQLGEYLKGEPEAKVYTIPEGGSLTQYDPRTKQVKTLVVPNDGSHQPGAPVQQAGNEVTATGPNGQKIRLNPQTNQWEPAGGPTPSASGGFPY